MEDVIGWLEPSVGAHDVDRMAAIEYHADTYLEGYLPKEKLIEALNNLCIDNEERDNILANLGVEG